MKSLTFLFVFLLLGSIFATLGQTPVPAVTGVPVIQPGGLLEIHSSEALCLPTTIQLPVSKASTVPLPFELGGCRVQVVQASTGVFPVRLTDAWTVAVMPMMKPGPTVIKGLVPIGLRQGTATLYIERIEPVSDQSGNVTQVVRSVKSIDVTVSGAVSSGIVIPTACDGDQCMLPDGGFELQVSIGGGEPVRAKLVGVVNKISLE